MKLALTAALIAATTAAQAGTCHFHSYGTHAVESCSNGSFTVFGRHGHRRQYGIPNAGFERYPGQPQPPFYEHRDDVK